MSGFLFKRKKGAEKIAPHSEERTNFNSVFNLKKGESGKILAVNITGNAAVRLNSLGITAGKKITVLSYSLFKSAVLIGCGAVRLGIRKSLAKQIEVEQCA